MSRMEFGIVHLPKHGRDISGDAYLIKEEEEATLVCLVDGLGSGEAAAEAAQAAIRCVEVSNTSSGIHVRSTALIKPISRNGIVGYRLPRLQEFTYPYTPGDLFVLHTDGISSRFTMDGTLWTEGAQDVQTLADEIARNFGKENDDVTVLAAR